ncbi:hypothetical protein CEXT_253531 [Caerostris extrusa]|uniref:C2H2-type domain-containing protein n=1 Tax=Caerostris extrusa TaxID=172846 RepID=A0AAV4MQJ1_CAEEX|nr:hypothetical protein CEXT_253531 [Caerostris extrusa]
MKCGKSFITKCSFPISEFISAPILVKNHFSVYEMQQNALFALPIQSPPSSKPNAFYIRHELRGYATLGKPYACNKCSKGMLKIDLKHHMLKHIGEEGSKCDSCGAEFSSGIA